MLTNREKQLSYVVRVRILNVKEALNYEKNHKMNPLLTQALNYYRR